MRSPLAWLSLGVFIGVWSWLFRPVSPWALSIIFLATLALTSRSDARIGVVVLGLCIGQALVWTQPEPGQLRAWTTGEVRSVTGKSALLLTPEGHLWTQLWPKPPPVGTRIAGRMTPKASRKLLPGEWPQDAQAQLARARSVRMTFWTPLTSTPEPTRMPDGLVHPGLLRALGSGDRSEVPRQTTDLMRRTGTVHLLAISGLHVGMISTVAGLLAWLLSRALTRGRWPPLARILPVITAAGAAIGYGSLVQWPVSTQRAVAMVVSVSLLSLCGRRPDPWQVLGLAAIVVLGAQPSQAASLGFLMSFGAVAAILVGMPVWTRLIQERTPWIGRVAVHSIGATVFATLGTLPVTAWVFQTVSLSGPLANLLAVPILAGLGVPLAIFGTLGPSYLQAPCLWVADRAISLALMWIEFCDIGTATPAIGAVGALVLMASVATLSRPHWTLVLMACALSPWRPAPEGLTVTFPGVGQGSAVLIRWPDGRHWLIDGGPPGLRLLHWLRREGVHRIERVILSHPDKDHFGGLLPVVRSLPVDEFWTSRPPEPEERDYRQLWRDVHAREIPVRAPSIDPYDLSEDNDHGLVVTLRHGGQRFLFLGDVSDTVEDRIAEGMPNMSVVHVSHHGSKTASSPALIAAAEPQAAVIQSGEDNRFGHPHAQTLARWAGTKVHRTDTLGSIRFRSDGRQLIAQRWTAVSGWRSLPDRPPEFL